MLETLATITTSRRLTSALVDASRRRSISWLIEASFLDVDVPLRDVGFRLVVVVVADEIMHRRCAERTP